MKRYRITLGDRAYDVRVLGDPRQTEVAVEVDGEVLTVGVETMPTPPGATADEAATGIAPLAPAPMPSSGRESAARATDREVVAPLPGVVKSISVRPGQRVAPNDELLVIEAMKMDNVIRAVRAGTVGSVHVSEGRQVAYGDSLLEFVA
jgi:biotin carboxyl carrier protein